MITAAKFEVPRRCIATPAKILLIGQFGCSNEPSRRLPNRRLELFHLMCRRGKKMLVSYVTESPEAEKGRSRLLLINNSSLPFPVDRINPLGVMHKAEILIPNESEHRIVNSTMLVASDTDKIRPEQQRSFVATDRISKRAYYLDV